MKNEIEKRPFQDDQAWVTYLHPFTVVRLDSEPDFTVPLDQINANSYDHGKLCEVVTTLPLSEVSPLALLVCFDGALAIPRIKPFTNKDSVLNRFNHILCALLLGGVLCEAIDRRDIDYQAMLRDPELMSRLQDDRVSSAPDAQYPRTL